MLYFSYVDRSALIKEQVKRQNFSFSKNSFLFCPCIKKTNCLALERVGKAIGLRDFQLTVSRQYNCLLFLFLAILLFPVDTFAFNYFRITSDPQNLNLAIINLVLYLFSILSLQTAITHSNFWIRTISEIYLFSSVVLETLFFIISGHRFSTFDAINLSNNSHYGALAFQNFSSYFLLSFVLTGLAYLVITYLKNKTKRVSSPVAVWIIIVSISSTILFCISFRGRIDSFAITYRAPYAFAIAAIEQKNLPASRIQVAEIPKQQGIKHLFFVVDESITANNLTINDSSHETTPYLASSRELILNFGIAASYTNYSSGSNISLISGALNKEIPDKSKRILRKSTIFQYAKKAGYKTYFIDAQTDDGKKQNFMNDADFKYIDIYLSAPPGLPLYLRDMIFADTLINLSRSEEKVFVYYNKYGAHWPYKESFPSHGQMLTLEGSLVNQNDDVKDYNAALKWTVDVFWKKLISNSKNEDSLLILYTSDHGQSFSSNPMRHGTIDSPDPMEASVPLWIYEPTPIIEREIVKSEGIASHANIFPSLLLFMGYDKKFTSENYGHTLLDSLPSQIPSFISGDIFERTPAYRNKFLQE